MKEAAFALPASPAWAWIGGSGGAVVLAAAVLAWLGWRGRWRDAFVAVVAVALTDLACARLLKPAVERPRPCAVDPALAARVDTLGVPCGAGWSFPSNHAANTAALAAATGSGGLALVAAGVGATRIALGQHYPTDVAAGWGIGLVVGMGVTAAARGIGARMARPPARR